MGGKIRFRITEDIRKRFSKAKLIIFFLDYDGTLVPIRKKPSLAKISRSTKKLLLVLSKKKWAKVYIVTGRTLKNIKSLVGIKSVSYVGNHGFELEDKKLKYSHKKAESAKSAIKKIYRKIKKDLARIPGVIIENKFYTLSVHYRLVRKNRVRKLKKQFYDLIHFYKINKIISLTKGKKVFEIRPNLDWNKGKMVRWIWKSLSLKGAIPIYIGDDSTDEDAFRLFGNRAVTIRVSDTHVHTEARYVVRSTGDVAGLLRDIMRIKKNG